MSHYRPAGSHWSIRDVAKYSQWYFSWINYLEKLCPRLRKKANIFEIGSAVGSVAKLLHERGHVVTGSDISPLMVAAASKLCAPIPFITCDIEKPIPFKKKFDVIIAFEVLEHLHFVDKGLKNIRNSLVATGSFIGTTPYPFNKNFLDPTHVNVKYPGEWKRLLYQAGFSRVSLYPLSFLPFAWRISKYINPVLPFYVPLPFFVSTTLVIAKK